MAEFVGGVGAAFIMAAVAALIVKFLVDDLFTRETGLKMSTVPLLSH